MICLSLLMPTASRYQTNWLRDMWHRQLTAKTEIIIGYGGYIPEKGLLNRYITV